MELWELLAIALSLSADAFAVAVCKGLSLGKVKFSNALTVGLYFGIAQGAMPLIGYFLASTVASRLADYSFYIAFVLLALIGGNMIKETLKEGDACPVTERSLSFKAMMPMAIATSIDALAVGVSFALVDVEIFSSASIIAATTLITSALGVALGAFVGGKFRKAASIVGGTVLILMGLKILLEGLNVI